MQSTNLKEIKSALWDQAFIGRTWVSCPMGRVVGIRRRKGSFSRWSMGGDAGTRWSMCSSLLRGLS